MPRAGVVRFWSDAVAGPRFHAAEVSAFAQDLAMERFQEFHLNVLGEQHDKGLLDAMLGVVSDKGEAWVAKCARSHNIFNIDELVNALLGKRRVCSYPFQVDHQEPVFP